jgi:DNA-binding IclR family transcriptional regulator
MSTPTLHGSDFVESRDGQRLRDQYTRILELMRDGRPRTLSEISRLTGAPPASVSAQLRSISATEGIQRIKEHLGNGLFSYRLDFNARAQLSTRKTPSQRIAELEEEVRRLEEELRKVARARGAQGVLL